MADLPPKPSSLRGVAALIVVCLALAPRAAGASPRPGALDRTFAGTGVVRTDIENGSFDEAYDVLVQRDGNTVVAGTASSTFDAGGFAVARYLPTGVLDRTFDADGKVRTGFGSTASESGHALALQPDGKYVVAGGVSIPGSGTSRDFALVRYTSEGALDTAFDGDGKVITDFGSRGSDEARDVAVQSDGKIVAVGWSQTTPGTLFFDFAVARYNADGSLDDSFSGDGKVTTSVAVADDYAFAVAVQPDGKIVVAGLWGLVRYLPDGRLDAPFGSGGIVSFSSRSAVHDLALRVDGKILAAGPGTFSVTRYNATGTVDRTFGAGGTASALGQNASAVAILVQPDGKIVVAGDVLRPTGRRYLAVGRFKSNGVRDTTFGNGGTVTTDAGDSASSVALAPGGKIVVAGTSRRGDRPAVDFAVVRYIGALAPCRVPNVRGNKLAAARARIARGNCRLGKVRRQGSTRVKNGRVISQRPRAGATLSNGGRVNLVVSTGWRR